MQNDKHNIYSKEELLKLIKEGKNAPADMDEFEREALEGLKLLDKSDVLNDLDAEIDAIVAKDKNRKKFYYFSAAASFLLIIGFILFFKNAVAPDITKNEKPIASAENLKKPDELTLSNTTPITQPETQTTYEAKEPEAITKKTPPNKEGPNSLLSQTSSPPVTIQEKAQEGKDADEQQLERFESKKALSTGNNYEESKVSAPQVKQEQQQDLVVATENEMANNNRVDKESDKSKTTQASIVPQNANQPMQMASSKSIVAADNASHAKKDESAALQKNVSAGLSYASNTDKKTNEERYREPAFINGDAAFATYAKLHLKISSSGESGIIEVEFLITKSGKAEKIKITKPLNDCHACSQDVIDLIKSVEKWSPAAVNGNNSAAYKKISIQYN